MGNRPYYTLFVRQGSSWAYEFGDFEKACVEYEQQDWVDHIDDSGHWRRKKDTRLHKFESIPNEDEIKRFLTTLLGQ